MKYLLIDTATSYLIVSIVIDDKLVYLYNQEEGHRMSERVMPVIAEAFDKAGIKPKDLDMILATTGPGSFTGIRDGLTVAKTMAWSLKIPVVPISTLEVMVSGYDDKKNIGLINARRGFVYAGIYDDKLNVISEDRYDSLDDISLDGNLVSYDLFDFEVKEPKLDVLKIVSKHKDDTPVNPHLLNPKYLKRTEAEEKLVSND